jgi:hypothetical protein
MVRLVAGSLAFVVLQFSAMFAVVNPTPVLAKTHHHHPHITHCIGHAKYEKITTVTRYVVLRNTGLVLHGRLSFYSAPTHRTHRTTIYICL